MSPFGNDGQQNGIIQRIAAADNKTSKPEARNLASGLILLLATYSYDNFNTAQDLACGCAGQAAYGDFAVGNVAQITGIFIEEMVMAGGVSVEIGAA
jgi:hypothetical protein